jgi:hypothetical protein
MKKIVSTLIFCFLFFLKILSQQCENVTVLGRWPDGPCETIALNEDIVVIGNGSSIKILDASDPDSLIQLSQLDCTGFVWDIYLFGDTAFIGTDYGILTVDISEPTLPEIISEYKTSGKVYQVFFQSDKLFFTEDSTLKIFTEPTISEYVIFASGRLAGFFIKDTLAYVNDGEEGLHIIDISDINEPEVLSVYQMSGNYSHGRVYVFDEIAYITAGGYFSGKVQLLDISNPYLPIELGYLYTEGDLGGSARDISINDTTIFITYMSDVGDGFIVANIADPSSPYVINEIQTDSPNEVIFYQNKLFISGDYLALRIYDVANVYSVFLINEYNTRGITYDIFAKDDLAFIANDKGGLRTINFEDFNNIYEIGFFDLYTTMNTTIRSVCVRRNLAYVASGRYYGGLRVVDVTIPQDPIELSYAPGSYGNSIVLENDFAFIADEGGMSIFDVSDSTNPQIIWQPIEHEDGVDIFVEDTLCVLTTRQYGTVDYYLSIYGISNLSSPVLLSKTYFPSGAAGVYIVENILYVACGGDGLQVFDITNPSSPVLISTYSQNSRVLKVSVVGDYAYITDWNNGLEILDITNLNEIVLKGYYRTRSAKNVFVRDSLIFLSEGSSGFSIIRNDLITKVIHYPVSIPQDFLLYQNYPNPFNPVTSIQYAISSRQFVTLKVYDILGSEVATLVDEEKPAGEYEVEFDASELPSGIYFYKLTAGEYNQTRKMLLLK